MAWLELKQELHTTQALKYGKIALMMQKVTFGHWGA